MSTDHELTIVLVLKDRVPYTQRWMAYGERFRLPFKVLIADGGTDDRAGALLSNRDAFPHVDYEYVRYPPDRDYSRDYWAKLSDALTRVRTPLVALAHNDDLFVINGVRHAVQFLLDHPEYATCGGRSAVFWIPPPREGVEAPCYGPRVQWKSHADARSLDDERAAGRIRQLSLLASAPTEHHVRRTDHFRSHVEIIRHAGLQDVFLIERLFLWLTAIAGRTQQLDTLFIARQWNAPASAGLVHEAAHGDWFERMLVSTWSDDFARFTDIVSGAVAAHDGIPHDDARAMVVELYRQWLAPQLLGDLMAEPSVTPSMPVIISAVQRLLQLPEDNLVRRLARTVYRRTRWLSVDALHGTELRTRTVPGADKDFAPIRDFLVRQPGPDRP